MSLSGGIHKTQRFSKNTPNKHVLFLRKITRMNMFCKMSNTYCNHYSWTMNILISNNLRLYCPPISTDTPSFSQHDTLNLIEAQSAALRAKKKFPTIQIKYPINYSRLFNSDLDENQKHFVLCASTSSDQRLGAMEPKNNFNLSSKLQNLPSLKLLLNTTIANEQTQRIKYEAQSVRKGEKTSISELALLATNRLRRFKLSPKAIATHVAQSATFDRMYKTAAILVDFVFIHNLRKATNT
jgi:hypothetical protein